MSLENASESLDIPSLNAWRWRAERLLRPTYGVEPADTRSISPSWHGTLSFVVPRFFDNLNNYQLLSHDNGSVASSQEPLRPPRLSSILLDRLIVLDGNVSTGGKVHIPNWQNLLTGLEEVAFGHYQPRRYRPEDEYTTYLTHQSNTPQFMGALSLALQATADSSIYSAGRAFGDEDRDPRFILRDTMGLGQYIDYAAQVTSNATNIEYFNAAAIAQAGLAYRRHNQSLPAEERTEVARFHETVRLLDLEDLRQPN